VTRSVERGVQAAFLIGLGVSITLAQVALAALVGLWLLRLRDPAARAAFTFPLARPFLAFIAATLLAALLSADVAGSLYASKELALIAVFVVLVNTLPEREGAQWLLGSLFLVMVSVSALSLLQVLLCSPEPWQLPLLDRWLRKCTRARGFYSIYMTLAGVLTLALLASLPQLWRRDSPRLPWKLPGWILMFLALVLTYTRGAWLGFLAGMGGLIPLAGRRRSLSVIVGSILLLFVLVAVGSSALSSQLWGLRNLADPTTFLERLYMWRAGIGMLGQNPVTGIGVGRVKTLYPRYVLPQAMRRSTSHLHSSPLQVLVERGLLGLGSWLWLWGAYFLRGLRILNRAGPGQERERALVLGSLAAILGFLVSGLSENNFGDSEVVMVAYAVMAIPFLVEPALAGGVSGTREAGGARSRSGS
jgi:O-antigen ligase